MADTSLTPELALRLAKTLISSFDAARQAIGDRGPMDAPRVSELLLGAREMIAQAMWVTPAVRTYATAISRESALMALDMRIRSLGIFLVGLERSRHQDGFSFDEMRAVKEIAAAAIDIDILLATPTFSPEKWEDLLDGTG